MGEYEAVRNKKENEAVGEHQHTSDAVHDSVKDIQNFLDTPEFNSPVPRCSFYGVPDLPSTDAIHLSMRCVCRLRSTSTPACVYNMIR
jgi:hypothetical protein